MLTDATRPAVRDLLAHGLRGDLAHSQVGVDLGQHLRSALTADVGDGATADDVVAYVRLLELVVVAGLDELQVLAGLTGDLEPTTRDLPPAPPRRPTRRRR